MNFGVSYKTGTISVGRGMPLKEEVAAYWPGTTAKGRIKTFCHFGVYFNHFPSLFIIQMTGVLIRGIFRQQCIVSGKIIHGKQNGKT
jgi:hypothetical protein